MMHDTTEGGDTQATPNTHDIGQVSNIQTDTRETGLEAQAKLEIFPIPYSKSTSYNG
jgi:hypothetical protein